MVFNSRVALRPGVPDAFRSCGAWGWVVPRRRGSPPRVAPRHWPEPLSRSRPRLPRQPPPASWGRTCRANPELSRSWESESRDARSATTALLSTPSSFAGSVTVVLNPCDFLKRSCTVLPRRPTTLHPAKVAPAPTASREVLTDFDALVVDPDDPRTDEIAAERERDHHQQRPARLQAYDPQIGRHDVQEGRAAAKIDRA